MPEWQEAELRIHRRVATIGKQRRSSIRLGHKQLIFVLRGGQSRAKQGEFLIRAVYNAKCGLNLQASV